MWNSDLQLRITIILSLFIEFIFIFYFWKKFFNILKGSYLFWKFQNK